MKKHSQQAEQSIFSWYVTEERFFFKCEKTESNSGAPVPGDSAYTYEIVN